MANQHTAALAANTLTDLTGGGLAAGKGGSYLLNILNRSASARLIRVAITTGGSATAADYIEWDAALDAAGTDGNQLSRWPIALGVGWRVFVQANGSDVTAVLNGQED
jgi:hypothetical protein